MSRSAHTTNVLGLLASMIAQARRERRWTIAELAERVGVSEPTISKVERGDPGVAIGTVFECATLLGVPLFADDRAEVAAITDLSRNRLALLPRRVRRAVTQDVDSAF